MGKLSSHFRSIQLVFLVLGIALFIYVISSVGTASIIESIRLVGFGFVVIILASAVRYLIRSAAWFQCIDEDQRNVTIWELFNVRLAGDAVKLLSFTGPFLGEPSKALLLKPRLPMIHGLSSIAIENLAYALSVIFVVTSGLILLVVNFGTRSDVKVMGLAMIIGMIVTVVLIGFIIVRQKTVFATFARFMARTTSVEWFGAKADKIADTETKVHDFYRRRGSTLFLVLLLELAANLAAVMEVYLILYFMETNAGILKAYIIEAMMKVVNILFFFVPGQIGVLEGSNALLLKMLGLGLSAGVTLSLIEKIRSIFWAGYGLVIWMLAFRNKAVETAGEIAPKEI